MRGLRDKRILPFVVLAFVNARLTGGQVPYFLFYFATALWLAAWAWTAYSSRNLSCSIKLDKDVVHPGETLAVRVRLDNDAILPIEWLEVDDRTPSPLVSVDVPRQAGSVPASGSRILNFGFTARRRGHYNVGPIRVTTGDPFGLYRSTREFQSRSTVTVYPRVWPISGLPIPLSQPFGPVRTRQQAFEDYSNHAEIRPYRPGDNPRHIHWRTTARRGELMLKQYELQATTQLFLVPDLQAGAQASGPGGDTAEMGIEIAASLAQLGLVRGFEVGMVGHGAQRHAVPLARGQRAFAQVMETLTRVEADGQIPIDQVLGQEAAYLTPQSGVVVITATLSSHLADVLLRLGSNHAVMLVLLRGESFAGVGERAPVGRDALAVTLSGKGVAVYLVGAGDDLRRLAELRVGEGEKWSHFVRGGRSS